MIDIEKAKNEFLKYVSTYDDNHPKIISKREHSLRVMEISKEIATNINLTEEEINLATLIGLLHDIGRFDQMKIYNTFIDLISIDHGDYGVEILEKNNLIRKFIKNDEFDSIIKYSIKNHNKIKVENGLDKHTLMFCNIIRDADKIDILNEAVNVFWPSEEEVKGIENSLITKDCYNDFMQSVPVRKKSEEEPLDSIIVMMAFIYDMNFDYSLKYIYERDYYNKILDRFNFKNKDTIQKLEMIKNKCFSDLKEKVGK